MAIFASHMGDPHGDPQTSPQRGDPHGLGAFLRKTYKKSIWIGVLWAGLRVAMWIAHVGGKYRHGLLEKSLNFGWWVHLRKRNPLSLKRHLFPHGDRVKMLAQGFLDLFFDAAPPSQILFQFSRARKP